MTKNLFYYLDGLGALPSQAMFRISLSDGYLLLDYIKLHVLKKDEILQRMVRKKLKRFQTITWTTSVI